MPVTALADHTRNVLRLMAKEHNVLISGAPGTGKTRLLNAVAMSFVGTTGAVLDPAAQVPIPDGPQIEAWMPSPARNARDVFPTVFDPKTKYRDFLRGLVAVPSPNEQTGVRFRVSKGTLYRANEYAAQQGGAALVTIDEINRGPAVEVFGDSIVAIEPDKRLDSEGQIVPGRTQRFEILDDDGEPVLYTLSRHLYMAAAMNQADTSVQPLDVAFQRRWAPYRLLPDTGVLVDYFGLGSLTNDEIPVTPSTPAHVYIATVRAWEGVNHRIALGRGNGFQIGHGVLMDENAPPQDSVANALRLIGAGWSRIRSHVDEVFFGDTRSVAAALNVGSGEGHPYTLHRRSFADQRVLELEEPPLSSAGLYPLLRAVGAGA